MANLPERSAVTGIDGTALLYVVKDPGGTPSDGKITLTQLLTDAGLVAGTDFLSPAAITAAYQPLDAQLTALADYTVLDEDNMASDSATGLPTQQSVKAYVDASVASAGVTGGALAPVRVAAATNITIASPGATINGVTMASGDRTLHTAQTAGAENGPWVWNGAASAMTRPADFDADADAVPGLIVPVGPEGTADADTTWRLVTAGPITLGTTALTFALDGDAMAAALTEDPVTTLADDDFFIRLDPNNATLSSREKTITYANLKVELTADLAFAPLASPNAQTGTTYTLVLGDANDEVTMSNASANTLTIPPNSAVAFPVGAAICVSQLGAGATSIAGDTGVTVNGVSAGTGTILTQYGGVSLLKIATDTWLMQGAHGGVA